MSATSDTPSRILTRTPSSTMTGYTEPTAEALTEGGATKPATDENRKAKANSTGINNCDPPWKSESGVYSLESGVEESESVVGNITPDSRLQTLDSRLPTPDFFIAAYLH